MTDGNLRSVKVYGMFALAIVSFTFRWFDKIDEGTLIALVVPTFVAWLAAHVKQQMERIKGEV